MSKTAPVLNEHSADESQATIAATSSISPNRPIGIRLGGRIRHHAWVALLACNGGDVDYAAVVALQHVGDDRLHVPIGIGETWGQPAQTVVLLASACAGQPAEDFTYAPVCGQFAFLPIHDWKRWISWAEEFNRPRGVVVRGAVRCHRV